MAENLLWPTKLSTPPQLLIDPEVIFNGEKDMSNRYTPLVYIKGPTEVRYIGLVPDGFMIGFVANINKGIDTLRTTLKLPFQEISTEILQYKMHGWHKKNVDILSTPDKTEWKTNLNVPAHVSTTQSDELWLKKPLFKMVGESLEDGGSKPQFSSNMAYSEIDYLVPYDSSEGDFGINLTLEFPDMFSGYDPASSTLAIETVVKVNVISATDSNGFKVGVVSS